MQRNFHIELVDNMMTLLDGDNNGCDAYVLRSYDAAKKQLDEWRKTHTFDEQEALRLLGQFFEAELIGEKIAKKMEQIAKQMLNIPTLECRGSDSLDFYELYVEQIALALRTAYEVGRGDK